MADLATILGHTSCNAVTTMLAMRLAATVALNIIQHR